MEVMVWAAFQPGLPPVPSRSILVSSTVMFSNHAAFRMKCTASYQLECKFHESTNAIFASFIHWFAPNL